MMISSHFFPLLAFATFFLPSVADAVRVYRSVGVFRRTKKPTMSPTPAPTPAPNVGSEMGAAIENGVGAGIGANTAPTTSPVSSPALADSNSKIPAGSSGDPHMTTWGGEHYDYHGVCDLVLLENYGFHENLGMVIHIRTKKIREWSYISNAVLRIGEDVLEIMGSEGGSQYWINGIAGNNIEEDHVILTESISGYPISFRRGKRMQNEYIVDLGNKEMIVFKTWNDLVRVDVINAKEESFGQSRGLMGNFDNGKHMARDNLTELKDLNAFGQEWQVLVTEPILFHNVGEGPQAPQPCEVPTKTEVRRRLRESFVTQERAEIACSSLNKADRVLCVFDVMATNNLDLAYAYQ